MKPYYLFNQADINFTSAFSLTRHSSFSYINWNNNTEVVLQLNKIMYVNTRFVIPVDGKWSIHFNVLTHCLNIGIKCIICQNISFHEKYRRSQLSFNTNFFRLSTVSTWGHYFDIDTLFSV